MYLKYLYQLIYSFHDPVHVERFQKYFGLEIIHDEDQHSKCSSALDKKYRIKNYFWYYMFSFGARLGYELFYAFSFSYLYWNLDSFVCRQLMLVWAVLMYIGQALKDIIRIPRPNGTNILILEPQYSLEYGMPSTHAMLALMVPVTLFSILSKRYELSSPMIFIICSVCWCALICCSRLYLGMHSLLDILVGLLLTAVLLVPMISVLDPLDYFLVRHCFSPLILIPALLFLSIMYPKSNNVSPSRADTITIISACSGVYLGTWLNYQLEIFHPGDYGILFHIVWPSLDQIPMIVTRTIIGLCSLFLLQTIGKQLSHSMIKLFMGIQDIKIEHKHLTVVEVPSQLIPFLLVGFSISFVGPFLARMLAIERRSMAFEV